MDPLATAPIKRIYTSWCEHVPPTGDEYDLVFGVTHKPLTRDIAERIRFHARRPDLAQTLLYKKLAHRLTIREQKEKDSADSSLQSRETWGEYLASLAFDGIIEDFGHTLLILRYKGHPIASYNGMRAVGFYPDFMGRDIINGVTKWHDETLGKAGRVRRMMEFQGVFPGTLSNDEDRRITLAAAFKVRDPHDVMHAFRECARNIDYHAFNKIGMPHEGKRRIQNCYGYGLNVFDKAGLFVPDEFRVDMPEQFAAAIEGLARNGDVTSGSRGKTVHLFTRDVMQRQNDKYMPEPTPSLFEQIVMTIGRSAVRPLLDYGLPVNKHSPTLTTSLSPYSPQPG